MIWAAAGRRLGLEHWTPGLPSGTIDSDESEPKCIGSLQAVADATRRFGLRLLRGWARPGPAAGAGPAGRSFGRRARDSSSEPGGLRLDYWALKGGPATGPGSSRHAEASP